MKVKGKEYEPIKVDDVSVRQSKILQLTAVAYDEYINATENDEAAKYEKLKVLWHELITLGTVSSPDEVVANLDNITPKPLAGFMKSFFTESSEAPK